MNFLAFLNGLPWVRPALMLASAAATLVKVLTPEHTVAHKLADQVLTGVVPFAAGSVGLSNSGLAFTNDKPMATDLTKAP